MMYIWCMVHICFILNFATPSSGGAIFLCRWSPGWAKFLWLLAGQSHAKRRGGNGWTWLFWCDAGDAGVVNHGSTKGIYWICFKGFKPLMGTSKNLEYEDFSSKTWRIRIFDRGIITNHPISMGHFP